jgi:hypothetical protein
MLAIANILFYLGHTALIAFNVFGWIPKRTRRWNLATLLLTLTSWAIMGLWYGMGYCICTDLHWQVRRAMGIDETADSYLVLLIRNLSGWNPPVALVNSVAGCVLAVSLVCSVWVNVKDMRRRTQLDPIPQSIDG